MLILNRSPFTLQAANRGVRIERNHEAVASGPRALEKFDMARVQKIEAPVRQAHFQPFGLPIDNDRGSGGIADDFRIVSAPCAPRTAESSSACTTAVPRLLTAIPAAASPIRAAVVTEAPQARANASAATTVSPAPETSKTCDATVGICVTVPWPPAGSKIVMPSAPRVRTTASTFARSRNIFTASSARSLSAHSIHRRNLGGVGRQNRGALVAGEVARFRIDDDGKAPRLRDCDDPLNERGLKDALAQSDRTMAETLSALPESQAQIA